MSPPSRLLPTLSRLAALLGAAAVAALAAASSAGAAAGTAAPEGTGEGATKVSGEVLVRFVRGTSPAAQAEVRRAVGLARPRAFAPRSRVLEIRDGDSVAETVRELEARPEVATAAPNTIARLSFIPDDPGLSGEAGGWQELQWNFLAGTGVNAPVAWDHLIDAGRDGGRGTVVAVLDTGVAYANRRRFRRSPDFYRNDFVRGYDFVDDDKFPNDQNGHGTHVASTIGESTHNGLGVTGLAYGTRVMPVRVLDRDGAGESADITAGIRFAVRRGADIINLSFEFDNTLRQIRAREIPDVLAALRFAARRDVVVVAAAGNQSRSTIAYPARHRSVIAVGATTEYGCRANYSNTGRGLDISAPGGGRDGGEDPACPPDLPAGRDIFQMTFPWASLNSAPRTSSFRRFGLPRRFRGTSMAAPHVSATAALVLASGILGPDPEPEAVKARLQATAVDAGVPGLDGSYGAGRLDAAAATDPAR